MNTPTTAESIRIYVEKLLAALERIAVALEAKVIGTPEPAKDRVRLHVPPVLVPDLVEELLPNQPVATYEDVRKAVLHHQDVKGAASAKNVLKSFGAEYIFNLKEKPEVYGDVIKALQ